MRKRERGVERRESAIVRFYLDKFEDYPKDSKAFIPFVL